MLNNATKLQSYAGWYLGGVRDWVAATELGDPEAQFNIGWQYHGGFPVECNFETAAKWYRKATAQGYIKAANNLGVLYAQGLIGDGPDLKSALDLWSQADGTGYAKPKFNLELMTEESPNE